jgi:hypothetical protein
MFNTEQMQTPWFGFSLPYLLMSRAVIDICSHSAEIISQTGLPAVHFTPAQQRFCVLSDKDRAHPLYHVLPAAARTEGNPQTPLSLRPIDIAFFGVETPRRERFFARNAGFLSAYQAFIYYRRERLGPITKGAEESLSRLAAHVSSHSKITLNIHRDEFSYFEWHRIVRLGMRSGSVVVTDPCLPHPLLSPGVHYFEEEERYIPNLLEWLIRSEEGQKRAEEVRLSGIDRVFNVEESRKATASLLTWLIENISDAAAWMGAR